MLTQSCLAFEISCETILEGGLTVVIAFVLFVGSVLLVLALCSVGGWATWSSRSGSSAG